MYIIHPNHTPMNYVAGLQQLFVSMTENSCDIQKFLAIPYGCSSHVQNLW
jgi:hypothetical protein